MYNFGYRGGGGEVKKIAFEMVPIKKTKLHGLSPRANYTDRATAACRGSDCQLLRIEGHVVSVTDPYGRILDFLDRSSYFSIMVPIATCLFVFFFR
jgi:hypothetical protein